MAQFNALTNHTITGIGTETAPGVHPGSVVRIRALRGDPLVRAATQQRVGVPAESPCRWDNPRHIAGGVSVEWGLAVHLSGIREANRLTPGATDTLLSHDHLLTHLLGRRYAAAGTTVEAGATTTVLPVASTTGRRVGEVVLVGHVVRVVSAVDTGAGSITVRPALPAAPAIGTVVRGTRTFAPSNARTLTLTLEQKLVAIEEGAVHEERVLGAFGAITWSLPEHGQIPQIQAQGAAMAYQGPSALTGPAWSLGDAPADDDMGPPLVWLPSVWLDGASLTVEPGSIAITTPSSAQAIGASGTRTGIGGWVDTAGRDQDTGVVVELTVRVDHDWVSRFETDTTHHLLVTCDPTLGTGSPTTLAAWEFPALQLLARPVRSDRNGRAVYALRFHALRDTLVPADLTSAAHRDLAWAPMRFALI
jgi:hypothetical protein